MEFNGHKPIYLQIYDHIRECIICGRYNEGDRIMSVRELGVELGVNPNTVMRSFELLQNNGIIANKRGIGYYVCSNAKSKILSEQKELFINQELPEVFRKMKLYNISGNDFLTLYKKSNEG
ncbi:MAG: GntR family transcriptional regulator [Candidatus Limimorpha sp.]